MVNADLVTYTLGEGNARLVIVASLRHRVASSLHAGHQGLDSMLQRAGTQFIGQKWRETFSTTAIYARIARRMPQSYPKSTPLPDYPFQKVVAYMYQLDGNTYLAYAYRLTGWLVKLNTEMGVQQKTGSIL